MRLLPIFVFLSISFLSVNADSKMVTEDKLMSIVEKQDMKYEHFKETTELNLNHKFRNNKEIFR